MRRALPILVPLAAYLFIAVVLPLANGAAARPEFREHCASIATVCATFITFYAAVRLAMSRLRRRIQS